MTSKPIPDEETAMSILASSQPASKDADAAGLMSSTVIQGGEYVQHGGDDDVKQQQKRGHVCCGCCCDTRKAVVVVNIVNITLAAMGIASICILANDNVAAQYDDDEVRSALNGIDGAVLGVSIAFGVVAMAFNAVAIYGAAKYNTMAVLAGAVWYVIQFVRSFVFFDIGGAIMAGLFFYPHWILHREIARGIMSPQTYPVEKHCCECNCCV
jgi:hypothetical protein